MNEERPSSRKSAKKKMFRNPLTMLKSKNVVGTYDYFSDEDHSAHSFEELPLGIHGNGWSYDVFDLDGDSDLEEGEDDPFRTFPKNSPPRSYAQIHFHTKFDNDDASDETSEVPKPCARERYLSALHPRPPSPPFNSSYASSYIGKGPSHHRLPQHMRAYEADSDTSGTVDTDDEYDDPNYTLPKTRTIKFADEEGHDLETVYITERDKDDEHMYHMRFIVLLLNPKKKQFEFLHLTTPRADRTHLSEAIKLFPDLASDTSFAKQKYVGLCRPSKGGQELINSLCLQDYDLKRDEITVAIPAGMKGKQIVSISKPLLKDRNVHKMIRRKMRSGFAVQSLPHAIEVRREAHHRDDGSDNKSIPDEFEAVHKKQTQQAAIRDTKIKEGNGKRSSRMGREDWVANQTQTRQIADDSDKSGDGATGADDAMPKNDGSKGLSVDVKDGPPCREEHEDQDKIMTNHVGSKRTIMVNESTDIQDEGNIIDKSKDTDEMERITAYIDDLQRDISSAMDATVLSAHDDVEETSRESEGGIAALFDPVESALNVALDEFHATELKARDRTMASVDVSFESEASDTTLSSSAPLSLPEVMELVSSVEDALLEDHFSPSTDTQNEVNPGKAGQGNDATIPSISANKDVSSAEVSPETSSNDVVGEKDTHNNGDMQMCSCPESTVEGVTAEASSDDSASDAGIAISPIDSDDDGDEDLSSDEFSSDEDEDDHDGSFPVVSEPSQDEIEDVPVIDECPNHTVDCLCSTNSMVGTLENGHVSYVHAHVKHIASGSFCTSPAGDRCSPAPDLDENVLVEVDELKNLSSSGCDEEEAKRRFLLLKLLNAAILVAVGFLLKFRKKQTTAKF